MTRGKIVVLQHFDGAIHGLLYDSFTTIEHKSYTTNWDQHDRWISIKNFIAASDLSGESRIAFWTGSGGSFPYFCASGKSSPQNGAPRLLTGATTPLFSSSYPDFPRIMCFLGMCSICFEGINKLGYNYIVANGFSYVGIIFLDFVGDDLISSTIGLNSDLFAPCPLVQSEVGCMACSTSGGCLSCDTESHYVLNPSTSSCDA